VPRGKFEDAAAVGPVRLVVLGRKVRPRPTRKFLFGQAAQVLRDGRDLPLNRIGAAAVGPRDARGFEGGAEALALFGGGLRIRRHTGPDEERVHLAHRRKGLDVRRADLRHGLGHEAARQAQPAPVRGDDHAADDAEFLVDEVRDRHAAQAGRAISAARSPVPRRERQRRAAVNDYANEHLVSRPACGARAVSVCNAKHICYRPGVMAAVMERREREPVVARAPLDPDAAKKRAGFHGSSSTL